MGTCDGAVRKQPERGGTGEPEAGGEGERQQGTNCAVPLLPPH